MHQIGIGKMRIGDVGIVNVQDFAKIVFHSTARLYPIRKRIGLAAASLLHRPAQAVDADALFDRVK